MKLGGSNACLKLGIIARSLAVREILLPMAACAVLAPTEKLFVVKGSGGALVEHKTVRISGAFPGGFPIIVLLNEVVKGAEGVLRVGCVDAGHRIDEGECFVI